MGVRVAVFHVFSAIAIVLVTDLLLRHALGLAPENYPIVRLEPDSRAWLDAWMQDNAVELYAAGHTHRHESDSRTGCGLSSLQWIPHGARQAVLCSEIASA